MKRFLKSLALGILLALPWVGASAQQVNLYCWVDAGPPVHWSPCNSTNPLVISGSISVTFPTIGAAVPSTGVYNGINVAGTLRGLSGLSAGSLFPAATAIVDASGNQITAFGGAATTSNASSGVATSSTNQASVVWNYVWNGATWDQAAGLVVGTAGTPSTQVVSVQGITSGTPVITQGASTGGGFPASATAITISATGTTGTVAAALAAASSKTTYICGFSITSDAVAGLSGNATVAGVITGTMTYIQGVGVAPAVVSTTQNFNPCIPASATNTAITTTSAAAGTGGTTAVNAWGYQQ